MNAPLAILIVDDSPDFLETMVSSLEDHYSVIGTDDPHEALMLADEHVGLLLSDVMMPDMTGIELANRVRQLQPAIKVLLMSGIDGHPPTYPVMHKPFHFTDLLTQIRGLLDQ